MHFVTMQSHHLVLGRPLGCFLAGTVDRAHQISLGEIWSCGLTIWDLFVRSCSTVSSELRSQSRSTSQSHRKNLILPQGTGSLHKIPYSTQGWGTCGPRQHLIRPASEFSLLKLEHNFVSKLHNKHTRKTVN